MTSIQPELWVDRGSGARVLRVRIRRQGAAPRRRGDDIVAQLAIGDAAFWIAATGSSTERLVPRAIGGATGRVLLVVDDPDAVFAQAVAAGAQGKSPVVRNTAGGWAGSSIRSATSGKSANHSSPGHRNHRRSSGSVGGTAFGVHAGQRDHRDHPAAAGPYNGGRVACRQTIVVIHACGHVRMSCPDASRGVMRHREADTACVTTPAHQFSGAGASCRPRTGAVSLLLGSVGLIMQLFTYSASAVTAAAPMINLLLSGSGRAGMVRTDSSPRSRASSSRMRPLRWGRPVAGAVP